MAKKVLIGALAFGLAAVLVPVAGATKKKPAPKILPYVNCAKLLPAAAANAATGGSLDLTSVTVGGTNGSKTHGHWLSQCTYKSGTLSNPPAGAIGYTLYPTDAASKKSFANVLAVYKKAAARNAARPECQPDWDAATEGFAPDTDFCQVVYPLGANSFQLDGYLYIQTPKYMITVGRGGHGDAATVTALGQAVLARVH